VDTLYYLALNLLISSLCWFRLEFKEQDSQLLSHASPSFWIRVIKKDSKICNWLGNRKEDFFSLILDNAFANDPMQNSLLCNGEFFHVHCSKHVLNIIVQKGLKVVVDALEKIRDSVKYVNSLGSRMKNSRNALNLLVGVECILKYQRVFESLTFHDDNYKFCPWWW